MIVAPASGIIPRGCVVVRLFSSGWFLGGGLISCASRGRLHPSAGFRGVAGVYQGEAESTGHLSGVVALVGDNALGGGLPGPWGVPSCLYNRLRGTIFGNGTAVSS